MFTHAAPQVLLLDAEDRRPAACTNCGRPERRVDRNVYVTGTVQAVPRMLTAPQGDEGTVAAPDRSTFVPVGTLRTSVQTRHVRVDMRDRRRRVEEL